MYQEKSIKKIGLAHAQPGHRLEAQKRGRIRVHLPRRNQPTSNRQNNRTSIQKRRIIPSHRRPNPRNHTRNHQAQNKRQVQNPTPHRALALDSLKPDRHIVSEDEEGSCDAEIEGVGGPDAAVLEKAGRDHGVFFVVELQEDEDADEEAEDDEEADDAAVGPGVGGSAPLKGEEEADDCWDEDGVATITC